MHLPTVLTWLYIYEMPSGVFYGQDCVAFPERTVCFGNEMPAPLDLVYINVSLNDYISTMHTCQEKAPWHLPRIQQPLQLNYFNYNPYPKSTESVSVVVMDTWMDTSHSQLGGRAKRWQSFLPHDPSRFPEHATHCAGLIGSDSYGTARHSPIYSVQVLDDDGKGDYATLITAIQYVYTQIESSSPEKFIVSLSLGGPVSRAVNNAVRALTNVAPVVVAAGNAAEDACQTSPASERSVVTVAASGPLNRFASFSNYGKCVDLIAPGESVLSLCPNNRLCWMSGTSMATPLAAGVLANYWVQYPNYSPAQILTHFLQSTARNTVQKVPADTVNKFLFKSAPKCLVDSDEQDVFQCTVW